jgi:acyl-CoA synthetase (AMP-forming)/AMP-acid ligase II
MRRSSCADSIRSLTPPARTDLTPRADLWALLSAALAEYSERPALAHGDTTLTFGELAAAADRLAAALTVAPGDRVVIVAPNVPALVVALVATWRVGAVAVPLTARLRRFELERVLTDAEPVAAVSIGAHAGFAVADELRTLAESTPNVRTAIVVDELGELTHQWRRPQPGGDRVGDAKPVLQPSPAAILYTSGTTGEPKGALVSHGLAVAMAHNLADVLGDDAGAPFGLVVPASHAFGLGCLLAGIVAGAEAVLVDATASLDPLVRALDRHDARVLHGSPALFGRLLRSSTELSLRAGFTAGSLCPPDTLESLDRRSMRVLNLYGMTEIGGAACCRRDDPAQIRYHTVGRALAGYELRIAPGGSDRAPAPAPAPAPDAVGEIQVRSRYLPSGYHRRPWTEAEAAGEWFRTGDLGTIDSAGYLTISGRAKEVVHVGGFNVFPAEVESFLLTNPAIAQAAVIGVPHPVLGEALRAFVAPVPGTPLDPRDVIRFARAGIAGYKVPYAIQILDELPLLASGKPDRRELARTASPQEAVR